MVYGTDGSVDNEKFAARSGKAPVGLVIVPDKISGTGG